MKRVHRKIYRIAILLGAMHLAWGEAAQAAEQNAVVHSLEAIVVTAPPMTDPLTVETDPKAPRQPVPASDGASFLKNIPGFSITRKGGTDGDPSFRGLGGSRLNILQNDDYIFGGCGSRMDPPTAYIYPEIYDTMRFIKGPQTVLHGGGNLAGTVLFERTTPRFESAGTRLFGSALFGTFGRDDQVVDATAGAAQGFGRFTFTRSDMDDYQDGDGRDVHSQYNRWNMSGLLGWTPTADSRLEINVDRSDGEAAYADRSMDGVAFDRTGYGLRLESNDISELVQRLEFRTYHNYVDHAMDNYSLRTATGKRMTNNPDRTTLGGRMEAQLGFSAATSLVAGVDYQKNEHTFRSAMSMAGTPSLDGVIRQDDARFDSLGGFGELTHELDDNNRLVGGLRLDSTTAKALKQSATYGGALAGTEDDSTNVGGFLRYERDMKAVPLSLYAGIGRAVRSPDYWERNKFFFLKEETGDQLDLGLAYRSSAIRATASLFSARIDDYILIDWTGNTAHNIDATLYGGEADITWFFARYWRVTGTASYSHGDNDTFDTPLAQVAPPEATLNLTYDDSVWSAGITLRAVAGQDREHVGYGSIAGQDLGETPGFATLAVNGGYRSPFGVDFTAGVDNLLDKTYAEHISRAGAAVGGYEQTERVNEPGRMLWIKASASF